MFVEARCIHALDVPIIQIVFHVDCGGYDLLLKHFDITEVARIDATDHPGHLAHRLLDLRMVVESHLKAGRAHGQELVPVCPKLGLAPRRVQRHLLRVVVTVPADSLPAPAALT